MGTEFTIAEVPTCETFTLTHEEPSIDFEGIDTGKYSIEELGNKVPSIECEVGEGTTGTATGNTVSGVSIDELDVSCTFTNTYTPIPPPPVGCIDNPNTPANECAPPPPFDECPNLSGNQAPGTDCTPPVTVRDACPELPGVQRLPESCIEVLVEPPVTAPPVTAPPSVTPPSVAPEQTPKPEVRGVQVTRQLPRTGSESADLAGYGAGLLLLGAGLVITSRARRCGIAD